MIVLAVAAAVSWAVSEPVDGAIIVVILAVSGVFGFVQERRATIAMAELLDRVHVHADVLRDGREVEVLLDEVVVGDIVVLRGGDIVPGDLRVLESHNLLVDESSITGESMSVEKGVMSPDDLLRSEPTLPSDHLFFGSHVVSGTAHGEVLAVGAETRFGALVKRLESRDVRTSFERETGSFGGMLARVVALLVVVIVVVSLWLQRPMLESIMFALAVAIGITPQLLPAIVTVSLARGSSRMAHEQVLVKRLDSIEDFGAMSVLCCDKTGTLTSGAVELTCAVDVAGAESPRVRELAAVNASLQQGHPNALDQAIIDRSPKPDAELVAEVPYDFGRRRLSVLVHHEGRIRLITKGAFASVLPVCSSWRNESAVNSMQDEDRARVTALAEDLSSRGFRVLAIASREMHGATRAGVGDECELVLEGLLAFLDPPTPNARAAVARLRELDIDVALVTGDSPAVAKHVGAAVGLRVDEIVTGDDLAGMADAELQRVATRCRVFAQVDPVQKERVVRALQGGGSSVGYLGDGINDAAALRAADAGISVDGASDVAKHAAALVIMTKDLHVVVDGVRLGRATLTNTLKYIRVTISANFGNMVSVVVASAFLPFLPLLPAQILLLNLLSDVPALTIASDRVDPEEVAHTRRWELRALWRFMVAFGVVSSAIDLALFAWLLGVVDADPGEFRSSWFMLSLLTECLALLVLRTWRPGWRSRPALPLGLASAAVIGVGIALPFTAAGALIGLTSISASLLFLVIVLALAYVVLSESLKSCWRRHADWRAT